jgi:hypothetical protein
MSVQDLTPLLLYALGKRIDDPAAIALTGALGRKPFKPATPNNSPWIVDRKLGLEIAASVEIHNRTYWPPRKEGRLWLTWVSHVFLRPNYRGSLPAGFDWHMNDAALSARFERRVEGVHRAVRFALPPPRDGLFASTELGDDGRPANLLIGVAVERRYVTIHPGSRPEHSVESGFFAAWCALNGLLREGRIDRQHLDALKTRSVPPSSCLATALGGLLWQGDVNPEFDAFCFAYMNRLMEPDDAAAPSDSKEIFGGVNFWRKAGEPMTGDSWENYDRIAPRYALRFAQWRRGEITSQVHHAP